MGGDLEQRLGCDPMIIVEDNLLSQAAYGPEGACSYMINLLRLNYSSFASPVEVNDTSTGR